MGMLDVVTLVQRNASNWRYAHGERILSDAEDTGRQASAQLQRWGVEAQTKFGDGQDYSDKRAPAGVTEFVVVTILVSCYGTVCSDEEDLKVRSSGDLKKILDAICGVQADELMQLDVQWIPEEPGDSLSGMELTVKFPEMVMV